MRLLAVCAIAAASFTTSVGAFECPFGQEGPLEPVKWSAEPEGHSTYVRLGVRNTFDKAVRMVDAGVWFVDGLGRSVSDRGLDLDPDLQIAASGANISSMNYIGVERLVGAKVEDFTPHICTRSILFADGTKSEF